MSKDLIQLPESIPESVLGQSNRNLYLQQFLQDQLQKKSQEEYAQVAAQNMSSILKAQAE